MKKILLAAALLIPLSAGAFPTVFPAGSLLPTGVPQRSHVTVETSAEAAGALTEHDGWRGDDVFTGVGINVLYSGWRYESQYDISAATNSSNKTMHGLTIFTEMNSARNNIYFSAALEASNKCFAGASSPSNAACISSIDHTKVFNDLGIDFLFPAIGNNTRIDIFSTAFESVSYSTHGTVYVMRPEVNGGQPGNIFGWYSPTDRNIQNINAGNVFKVSVSAAVSALATLDMRNACGGALIITSTGAITLNGTTAFTTPSVNATDGTYNADCEVQIINANLVGGRTITIVDTADYIPVAAANSVLGPLGGAVKVFSYPTAGVWLGLTGVTK